MAHPPKRTAASTDAKTPGASDGSRRKNTRPPASSPSAGPPVSARRPGPHRRPPGPVDDVGWVWGKHAGAAALANPARHIHGVLATRNAARELGEAVLANVTVEMVDPKAIDQALPPGAVHQGLAVRCKRLDPLTLEDVLAAPGPILVLDQVTDPHNVGAVLRSAAAFNAAGVVLQDRKSPPLMGACAKAAVGAAERVGHARVGNIARALETLTAADILTIGLAGDADHTLPAALSSHRTQRIALVLGAEDKGLRPSVAEACAITARIPIAPDVESLNVSTAAAVSLYAVTQNGATP